MRTSKKLIIGLAVLAVSVMDAQGQETDRIRTIGLQGEPDSYLVRIDSKSDGNKDVYTVEAENRDLGSVTRINYHGHIEDLHTLKVPFGMVRLSMIDVNSSGLREIHLSPDTSLLNIIRVNSSGASMNERVLIVNTSASIPALDANGEQVYVKDRWGHVRPMTPLTPDVKIYAPIWLKGMISHDGGSGKYRCKLPDDLRNALHPDISAQHKDGWDTARFYWQEYRYRETLPTHERALGSNARKIWHDGNLSTIFDFHYNKISNITCQKNHSRRARCKR